MGSLLESLFGIRQPGIKGKAAYGKERGREREEDMGVGLSMLQAADRGREKGNKSMRI